MLFNNQINYSNFKFRFSFRFQFEQLFRFQIQILEFQIKVKANLENIFSIEFESNILLINILPDIKSEEN